MKEAQFQTAFSHWLKDNKPFTGVYELKICHEDKLPVKAVKEHQVNALLEAEKDGFYHKISDSSYGLKPFDTVWLYQPRSYVAILWFKPRKRKTVTLIRISTFMSIPAPNLAFNMARMVAETVFELGS